MSMQRCCLVHCVTPCRICAQGWTHEEDSVALDESAEWDAVGQTLLRWKFPLLPLGATFTGESTRSMNRL